jgi:hypothetical protein
LSDGTLVDLRLDLGLELRGEALLEGIDGENVLRLQRGEEAADRAGQGSVGYRRPVVLLVASPRLSHAVQAVELAGQRAVVPHARRHRFVEGDGGDAIDPRSGRGCGRLRLDHGVERVEPDEPRADGDWMHGIPFRTRTFES